MKSLQVKPRTAGGLDMVALGEVMLRLDPGQVRTHTASTFQAWEGGGEYNVARGLRRCFGLRTAVVTALADNPVGRLVEDLILRGGVETRFIRWEEYDGIGRVCRNGLNFTERGFGVRGAVGCSDRGHTAVSQLKPGQVDWDSIFAGNGVRWLHTGGIFAALSESTGQVALEAMAAAKRNGVIVSYDLNYRPSLWKGIGGQERAQEVNRGLAGMVDVMLGNEEDFTACLGFQVAGVDESLSNLKTESYRAMIREVIQTYPNFKVLGTTLRTVKSASCNDWGGLIYADGDFYEAAMRRDLEIYDRVGGGDSFASGLIYGLMELDDPQAAVEYGAAHGALAMTTPGDTSMATQKEVAKLAGGGSARVDR